MLPVKVLNNSVGKQFAKLSHYFSVIWDLGTMGNFGIHFPHHKKSNLFSCLLNKP